MENNEQKDGVTPSEEQQNVIDVEHTDVTATATAAEATTVGELKVIPIEERIKQLPVTFNATDEKLAELKSKFTVLKALNEDGTLNKEVFNELKEAKKLLRNTRSFLDAKKKELNADAIIWQKAVVATHKDIYGKIEDIEATVDGEIEKGIEVLEAAKREKEKQEAEAFNIRIQTIMENGMVYEGNAYKYGELEMEPERLKNMHDQDFQFFVETLKMRYKAKQEEEARLEAERIAEEQRKEKERLELEARNKELEERQRQQEEEARKLREEKERLEAERIAAENEAKAAAARAEQERKAAEEEAMKLRAEMQKMKLNNRISQCVALGLKFDAANNSYVLQDVNIGTVELQTMEEDAWTELIERLKPEIEQRIKAIQEAEEAARKQKAEAEAAARAEQERKAAEEKAAREKAEAEAAAAKLEAERKAEEERAARAEALRPDKDKIVSYLDGVYGNAKTQPEVNDSAAKTLLAEYQAELLLLNNKYLKKSNEL